MPCLLEDLRCHIVPVRLGPSSVQHSKDRRTVPCKNDRKHDITFRKPLCSTLCPLVLQSDGNSGKNTASPGRLCLFGALMTVTSSTYYRSDFAIMPHVAQAIICQPEKFLLQVRRHRRAFVERHSNSNETSGGEKALAPAAVALIRWIWPMIPTHFHKVFAA